MKIKKILISQPKPETDKSPYFDLAQKNNLCIDFKPFIEVEGISAKDFRTSKIDILKHTAVIFTSKTAIDHYFRICDELRLNIPETMKYFCVSESIAFYLQKYIVYRKRKIFFGKGEFVDLLDVIKKHGGDLYLLPLSDPHKKDIPKLLEKAKIKHTKAIFYRTISSNLTDIVMNYDMLVFFSPSGIKALFDNFPDFKQDNIKIASFGPTTAKAVKDAGLKLDVKAPTPEAPSMTMAIELFIKKMQKENGKS
jgi:uroporphyrinogen-III synthase